MFLQADLFGTITHPFGAQVAEKIYTPCSRRFILVTNKKDKMGRLFHRNHELIVTISDPLDNKLKAIADKYFEGDLNKVWQMAIKMVIFEQILVENGGEIFIKDGKTGELTQIR